MFSSYFGEEYKWEGKLKNDYDSKVSLLIKLFKKVSLQSPHLGCKPNNKKELIRSRALEEGAKECNEKEQASGNGPEEEMKMACEVWMYSI